MIANVFVLTLISAALLLLSLLAIGVVLVRLPETYFVHPRIPWWKRREGWTGPEVLKTAAKNLAGIVLVIGGGLLAAVPGVPGQSLLTIFMIFMGLFLVDFPGKYRFQCWILRRRRINLLVGRLRFRFGRPPLAAPNREEHEIRVAPGKGQRGEYRVCGRAGRRATSPEDGRLESIPVRTPKTRPLANRSGIVPRRGGPCGPRL